MTRRGALAGLAGFLAGSPLLRGQQDPFPLSEQTRVQGLGEMRNTWDFEAVFNANLLRRFRDYNAHGDGTEWTLRRNRQAFDWVEMVPGEAVDPNSVNLATQVYGTKMSCPIMIAPTASHGDVHPGGEAETHRGASAAKTPYIVAHQPSVPLEKVAAAADGPIWYQLYGLPEPEANRAVLELAQSVGCQAIVVTADQQASSYPRSLHDRNLRGVAAPSTPEALAQEAASAAAAGPALYGVDSERLWYNWQWLDKIRKFVHVPVLVKGILTGEDAQICAERDLGIIVSNHGGRSMDYDPSTLEVLPEIVETVRGRVPVLFDSGIRRGCDALKALALGANAVCVGRVPRWGLGAFGAPGLQRVLEILQAELVQAAAAAGHANLASINKNAVRTRFT